MRQAIKGKTRGRTQQRWQNHVVENDPAPDRHGCNKSQRGDDRIVRQIRSHPKPREECAFAGIKARLPQPFLKCLTFEIYGRKSKRLRIWDACFLETRSLPDLGSRMVYFEDMQDILGVWVPVGEGIEPCAENNILVNASLDGNMELVFSVSTACSQGGPKHARITKSLPTTSDPAVAPTCSRHPKCEVQGGRRIPWEHPGSGVPRDALQLAAQSCLGSSPSYDSPIGGGPYKTKLGTTGKKIYT